MSVLGAVSLSNSWVSKSSFLMMFHPVMNFFNSTNSFDCIVFIRPVLGKTVKQVKCSFSVCCPLGQLAPFSLEASDVVPQSVLEAANKMHMCGSNWISKGEIACVSQVLSKWLAVSLFYELPTAVSWGTRWLTHFSIWRNWGTNAPLLIFMQPVGNNWDAKAGYYILNAVPFARSLQGTMIWWVAWVHSLAHLCIAEELGQGPCPHL